MQTILPKHFQRRKPGFSWLLLPGGLGPTKDDITKHTFCTFFDDKLVENKAVLAHVEGLFQKYISTPISEVNRKQAWVPSRATVLPNAYGTAPGMWMETKETVYVSLPGVPFEMKHLMQDQVIPRIVKQFQRPYILHKTLMTYGLGESAIAERIADWELALPSFIKLAYLPSLGRVRLRLSARGTDQEKIKQAVEQETEKLQKLIGDIIYGFEEDESIEVVVGKLLKERGKTLGTAESCTGGKIAQQMTSVPGASNYFKGGIVSYATETKIKVLGINAGLIEEHSVVSEAVAKAMAEQAKNQLDVDFAIATTGNAGPTKGDSDADIGTVCIGIATPHTVFARSFTMGNHRERIVQKTVYKALELVQKEILKF